MNMTCLQRWLGAWIAIAEHIVVILTLGFVSPGWHVEWVLRCLGEKLPDEPEEPDEEDEYALIRYCPDSRREEFMNVGLVMFAGAGGNAVVDPPEERFRRLFPQADFGQAGAAIYAKCEEIQREWGKGNCRNPRRLSEWAASWGNAIQLGPFRPYTVTDLDADFERMFSELVGEPS